MTARLPLFIPTKSPTARSAHFVVFTSLHYQFIMVNYYHNKSIARTILQEEWNMKKLTAFVLSAMMVLSLAACGAKTFFRFYSPFL